MNTFKTRKCDSRCHNAKGKRCNCWCQGHYHGLGAFKANELFNKDQANNPDELINVEFIPAWSASLKLFIDKSNMPTSK